MSTRPNRLVLATGTGTGVGKTWWGAETLTIVRAQGIKVAARKPVQSGTEPAGESDAELLAAATGELVGDVCAPHRSYSIAWAPPMAARKLGAPPFGISDLVCELQWPPDVAVGWVEGVGGPRSPLADDGDTVDLAGAIKPDLVVLVADAGLGTVNAVRSAAAPFGGVALTVALNRFDPDDALHHENHRWLTERERFAVVTAPVQLAARLAPMRSG